MTTPDTNMTKEAKAPTAEQIEWARNVLERGLLKPARDSSLIDYLARRLAEREALAPDEALAAYNMLVLCGELDGMQRGETAPQYLRRLIDRLIDLQSTTTPEQGAAHRSEQALEDEHYQAAMFMNEKHRKLWVEASQENKRLRSALELAFKLPRPWIDGGVTQPEWFAAFDAIEAALKHSAPMVDREEVLEEAAKVADDEAVSRRKQAEHWNKSERRDRHDDESYERFARNNQLEAQAAERIANAIRALKHSPAPVASSPAAASAEIEDMNYGTQCDNLIASTEMESIERAFGLDPIKEFNADQSAARIAELTIALEKIEAGASRGRPSDLEAAKLDLITILKIVRDALASPPAGRE